MERSDEAITELEAIRDKLYREQPDTMGAVESIIDFLETQFCPHEYETQRAGGDPTESSSDDLITVCKKCGLEKND